MNAEAEANAWLRKQLSTLETKLPDASAPNATATATPDARPTVRRAVVADLEAAREFATLPDVTMYLAHDGAGAVTGFIVLSILDRVATLLAAAGDARAQSTLLAHISSVQLDLDLAALVILPASNLPLGPALAQLSGARKITGEDDACAVYVLPLNLDEPQGAK